MLCSLFTVYLDLCCTAGSKSVFKTLFAQELHPRQATICNENPFQSVKGLLMASLGGNFPMTNSNFMVTSIIFFSTNAVATKNVSSHCTDLIKYKGSLLVYRGNCGICLTQMNNGTA